jgi:mono/diheme cytochrome c family protein
MYKQLFILPVLLLAYAASTGQTQTQPKPAAPAEYKIPPEAARQPNPVKPTPESQARAEKLYGYDCAICHGKNGDGKGEMAGDMKTKMLDFTEAGALKNRTDGELFYIIKTGKGEMPPEGDRVKDEEVWNLVHYLRAFAKKNAGGETKP